MKIKIFFLILGIIGGGVLMLVAVKPRLDQAKFLIQQQFPSLPASLSEESAVIEEVGVGYVKALFSIKTSQFPTKEQPQIYERKSIKLLVDSSTEILKVDTNSTQITVEDAPKSPIGLNQLRVDGQIMVKIDGNLMNSTITEARAIYIWSLE